MQFFSFEINNKINWLIEILRKHRVRLKSQNAHTSAAVLAAVYIYIESDQLPRIYGDTVIDWVPTSPVSK